MFDQNKNVTFYLFKFHKFFDGILGYETLSELEALLDVAHHKIILPHSTINLQVRQMGPSETTLNAHTATVIKIPVSQKSGNVFLRKDIRICDAIIPSGLYNAKNDALASNLGEPVTFSWKTPITTLPISGLSEINQMNSSIHSESSNKINNLENLIRTQHLNVEEKHKLFKILQRNSNIIHHDNEKLSCTTAIKHSIKTRDDLPIHTKTYRYPNIHKAEVEIQIGEMLADGIIQHSISP